MRNLVRKHPELTALLVERAAAAAALEAATRRDGEEIGGERQETDPSAQLGK